MADVPRDNAPAPMAAATILYTNYRGETALRRVKPQAIYFGSTEYHPEPQWLMDAVDVDKDAVRTFALKDVHWWGGPTP